MGIPKNIFWGKWWSNMKKPFKNRGVFAKLILLCLFIAVSVSTMICFVACGNVYDNDKVSIEFDEKFAKFTAPKDVVVRVEKQTKYYKFEQVLPARTKKIGDLTQYVFKNNEDNQNCIFRIEKDGYITKAGYMQSQGNFEVSFLNKDEAKKQSASTEDLLLTNVGDNYFKVMQKGEKFDFMLFRNSMILNNIFSNLQIEPNFDVEILSGDSVTFEQKKENIFEVVAVGSGVTRVKVSYQPIEVLNKNKWLWYDKSSSDREVVVTFAVGEEYSSDFVTADWNSEFETIYFAGDEGTFNLKTNCADKVFCNGEPVVLNGNDCNLKIKKGANIVKIEKDGKSQFMTIFGAQISVHVQKLQDNKIKIQIQGIQNTIPKMSGLYNPTQNYSIGSTPTKGSLLQFVMANGDILSAKYQSQYEYSKNSEIEFVVKDEYLVDGKLIFDLQFCAEWWGSNLGEHQKITTQGIGGNLDAKLHKRLLGKFEKITID